MLNVLKVVGVGVAVAAIVLGGWLAGWWFKQENVEKESRIFRDSYANQERLREDSLDNLAEIQTLETRVAELPTSERALRQQLEAQGVSIIKITCNNLAQINETEPTLEQFAAVSCGF